MFTFNPIPGMVNEQLWTVPFELECYIALGGLAVIGIMRHRLLLVGIVAIGQLLWIGQAIKFGHIGGANGAGGPLLMLCFLVGILFFLYRDKILLSKPLLILALCLCGGLGLLPHGTDDLPIPATYVTVYLGVLNPPRLRFLLSGDYSYGLYLYGFPVQQAFASLGPWAWHWYLNLAVCLSAAFLVAHFSWHVVEKPALGLRRHLPAIERRLASLVFGSDFRPEQPIAGAIAAR